MELKKKNENKIKIDVNNIISKKCDHFIPLNHKVISKNNSLYLFLSEDNFTTFKDIVKNNNKDFDKKNAKIFISNSSEIHNIPIISDTRLYNLFKLVIQDNHLMKNLIFAITMQNLFNNK